MSFPGFLRAGKSLGRVDIYVYFAFCIGCGRTAPDPSSDHTMTDGTIVPYGNGIDTKVADSSLLYNEYPLLIYSILVSYSSIYGKNKHI